MSPSDVKVKLMESYKHERDAAKKHRTANEAGKVMTGKVKSIKRKLVLCLPVA